MAFQLLLATRNSMITVVRNTQPDQLIIYSGVQPVDCAQPDPSGPLVTMTLPGVPFGPVGGGTIDVSTTWTGTASGTGTAASWRLKSGGDTVAQGNCSNLAGTGDLKMSSTTINVSDTVNVLTFTLVVGAA